MKHIALFIILSLVFVAFGAAAQPLQCSEGQFSFSARIVPDGAPYAVKTDTIQFLGMDADGNVLLFADALFLSMSSSSMEDVLAGMDAQTIRNITDYSIVNKDASRDSAYNVQQALHKLGYLSSGVDGSFGPRSAEAVSAFQTAMGLEATGEADPLLQMLMFSMAEAPMVVAPITSPELSFAVLADRMPVSVEPLAENGMWLQYDDIAGTGFISNNDSFAHDVEAESDIDKAHFEISYGFAVTDDGTTVALQPVLRITCESAVRKVMEEITFKAGNNRAILPITNHTVDLSGAQSQEKVEIPLDEKALETLQGAADARELKIRITARYQTTDIVTPVESLSSIASFAKLAGDIAQ